MLVITNPVSRRGRAARVAAAVTKALDEKRLGYSLRVTEYPGHAATLAKEARDAGETLVICVGGDGTASEAAAGLVGGDCALGIIPAGTGDDFARYLALPKDPLAALEVALNGEKRRVDAGEANGRVFVNSAGSGFDVAVLRHTLFYKRFIHGILAYMLGVLRALFSYGGAEMELTYPGGVIRGQCLLVNVSNGRYYGGGMMVAPDADAGDGLFDVLWVDRLNRLRIPFLLAKFIKGKHKSLRCVHSFRCGELKIKYGDSFYQLDGDIQKGDYVEYRIIKSALTVKAPKRSEM